MPNNIKELVILLPKNPLYKAYYHFYNVCHEDGVITYDKCVLHTTTLLLVKIDNLKKDIKTSSIVLNRLKNTVIIYGNSHRESVRFLESANDLHEFVEFYNANGSTVPLVNRMISQYLDCNPTNTKFRSNRIQLTETSNDQAKYELLANEPMLSKKEAALLGLSYNKLLSTNKTKASRK